MVGVSLVLFPKLALGLSGFETGVAVMPLISAVDENERIRNARKLLVTAAVIMSIFLLATSFATTLLIEPSKFKEGGEDFEACLSQRSQWPEAQINAGIAHWKLGSLDRAQELFNGVLAAEPQSVHALRALAGMAIGQDRTSEALSLHTRLLELGERTPEILYNAALLLQGSGRDADAIALYREALAQQPLFAEALVNLGIALKQTGEEEEARSSWRKALKSKPELAHTYFETDLS